MKEWNYARIRNVWFEGIKKDVVEIWGIGKGSKEGKSTHTSYTGGTALVLEYRSPLPPAILCTINRLISIIS